MEASYPAKRVEKRMRSNWLRLIIVFDLYALFNSLSRVTRLHVISPLGEQGQH